MLGAVLQVLKAKRLGEKRRGCANNDAASEIWLWLKEIISRIS